MVGSPTMRSLRVGTAQAYEREGRTTRRPQHRFNLKTLPYQIQPLLIAPVLPGETLNGIMLQAQSWSEPLQAGVMRNIGWWCEYFFFTASIAIYCNMIAKIKSVLVLGTT